MVKNKNNVLFEKGVLSPLLHCKMIEEDVDNGKKRTLYNECGKEVGHIVYGIYRNHCEIVFLYVEDEYRRKGYAKELMRSVLEDEQLVEVRLSPKPCPKNGDTYFLSENDLKGFYKSFKFGIDGKNEIIFGL